MTLAEVVAEIERRFRCVIGFAYRVCETGDEYVELLSGGVKDEGMRSPAICGDEEAAVRLWVEAFEKYVDRIGAKPDWTLYWRIMPEMGSVTLFEDLSFIHDEPAPHYVPSTYHRVYSRLVISNGPVIYANEEEARAR